MAGEPGTVLNIQGDGEARRAVALLIEAEGLRSRDAASAAEARGELLGPGDRLAGLVLLDAALDGAEPFCRAVRDLVPAPPPLLLTVPIAAGAPAPALESLADDVLDGPPERSRWAPAIRAWIRVGARCREQRLEAARWRAILEALDEGVALVGPEGAIRWCNPALGGLLGADPLDLIGTPLADRAAALGPPGRPWPADRALKGGAPCRDEWEVGRRWYRSTAAPIGDGLGAVGGVVATIEEVTAEVQLRRRAARAEAEAGARAERIEQLERDARLYQALAGIGAPAEGGGPRPSLSRSLPDFFCDAVEDYGRVLELRLRRRGYVVDDDADGSAELVALAGRLGDAGAGPRDVVELHALALRQRASGAQSAKARAFADEAQVAVLELMGRLAEHYRAGRDAAARPGAAGPGRSPSTPE